MADTTTWTIDPAHSSVEFAVKHMMFTTVRGRFKDVKGTIVVDEQNPDHSSVNVEIAAASLDTGVADRDGHLRSADFVAVAHPPRRAATSLAISSQFRGAAPDRSISARSSRRRRPSDVRGADAG